MIKTSSFWVLVAMLIVSTGPVYASGGDWKMGPFGPYWDDNDWPEFTPMYWMEEFMNRLDDDDDDIRDWMRMNQYSNQFSPGANYPLQPYREWGAPYAADRLWNDPIYQRYPNYPSSRGWREGTRRGSRYAPYRLPELTPQEYRRLPRQLQRDYERAFMDRYLPEIYRDRELRRRRLESYRGYRPRRR